MTRNGRSAACLLLALTVLSAAAAVTSAETDPTETDSTDSAHKKSGDIANSEPVDLFDGQTLTGWRAVPAETAGDWSVRDGVILGHGSQNRLSYLVWQEADLADFKLELHYRLRTDGNTGVEIRSRVDTSGKRPFEGYHADLGHVGIGPHILGAWDFHFAKRNEPACQRGTSLIIDEQDQPHRTKIDDALTPADVNKRDWNHVRIVARGNHCQLYINDRLASEFVDREPNQQLRRGAIGLQLHDKGMQVEFKDIQLRRLGADKKPAAESQAGE